MSISHWLRHAALGIVSLATTTPSAAQYAPRAQPAGPSALPSYTPPYPQPALRPLDGSPRTGGVTYRDASGYREARTSVGMSTSEAQIGPDVWAGFYLGVHGGYAWGNTRAGTPIFGTSDTSGGFGGVHIGHNWQRGAFVFGLEGDGSKSWADGRRSFASGDELAANREWTSSLRGRAGYAFGNMLAYATVGGAVAGQTVTATRGGTTWRGPETYVGYVYGVGLEWQVMSQVSLRSEVLRYDFNERHLQVGGTQSPIKLDETVVRGGVSFRFN